MTQANKKTFLIRNHPLSDKLQGENLVVQLYFKNNNGRFALNTAVEPASRTTIIKCTNLATNTSKVHTQMGYGYYFSTLPNANLLLVARQEGLKLLSLNQLTLIKAIPRESGSLYKVSSFKGNQNLFVIWDKDPKTADDRVEFFNSELEVTYSKKFSIDPIKQQLKVTLGNRGRVTVSIRAAKTTDLWLIDSIKKTCQSYMPLQYAVLSAFQFSDGNFFMEFEGKDRFETKYGIWQTDLSNSKNLLFKKMLDLADEQKLCRIIEVFNYIVVISHRGNHDVVSVYNLDTETWASENNKWKRDEPLNQYPTYNISMIGQNILLQRAIMGQNNLPEKKVEGKRQALMICPRWPYTLISLLKKSQSLVALKFTTNEMTEILKMMV